MLTLIKFQCILRSCDRASWQILIIKPTRCTNFSNFGMKRYMFRTVPLSIIRSFSLQDQDGTAVPSWSCSKAVYNPVWHTTAECTVKNSWW
jgi:hypothetical protein